MGLRYIDALCTFNRTRTGVDYLCITYDRFWPQAGNVGPLATFRIKTTYCQVKIYLAHTSRMTRATR